MTHLTIVMNIQRSRLSYLAAFDFCNQYSVGSIHRCDTLRHGESKWKYSVELTKVFLRNKVAFPMKISHVNIDYLSELPNLVLSVFLQKEWTHSNERCVPSIRPSFAKVSSSNCITIIYPNTAPLTNNKLISPRVTLNVLVTLTPYRVPSAMAIRLRVVSLTMKKFVELINLWSQDYLLD